MILFENGSSVVQRQNFKAPDFPIGQQVYSWFSPTDKFVIC